MEKVQHRKVTRVEEANEKNYYVFLFYIHSALLVSFFSLLHHELCMLLCDEQNQNCFNGDSSGERWEKKVFFSCFQLFAIIFLFLRKVLDSQSMWCRCRQHDRNDWVNGELCRDSIRHPISIFALNVHCTVISAAGICCDSQLETGTCAPTLFGIVRAYRTRDEDEGLVANFLIHNEWVSVGECVCVVVVVDWWCSSVGNQEVTWVLQSIDVATVLLCKTTQNEKVDTIAASHPSAAFRLCWQRRWWWLAYAISWRAFRQSSITGHRIDEVNPRLSSLDTLHPSAKTHRHQLIHATLILCICCSRTVEFIQSAFCFVILLSTWRRMNGIRRPK